jgi:hypothetical protein
VEQVVGRVIACALAIAAGIAFAPSISFADPDRDAFAAGYVTAVLERELEVRPVSVNVRDGVATIEVRSTDDVDLARVKTLLSGVESVHTVELHIVEPAAADETAPALAQPEPASTPAPVEVETATVPPAPDEDSGTIFLPRGHLFDALLADPRWPRFSASYQNYFDDDEVDDIAAVNLGGEFPFLRWDGPAHGRMQLALQGGIFSIFDLAADSKDLVNADYRIAIPLTYRRGRLSALARFMHQSSHLGDEFLLRNRVDRVNLSYEAVDLMASHRPWRPLRLYAGAGYLFDQDPSDLDPWWAQTGAELTSQDTFYGFMRPVLATDLQFHDENDWEADVSVRTGVQFVSTRLESQRLYLLLEYYDGRNPNGQFFERDVEYAGLGIHGHF